MEVLFKSTLNNIVVTHNRFEYKANSYPIKSILKISRKDIPVDISNIAINAIMFLLAIGAIASLKIILVIIGLFFGFICGSNLKGHSFDRVKYRIDVHFVNGENVSIGTKDEETATNLVGALNEAMA